MTPLRSEHRNRRRRRRRLRRVRRSVAASTVSVAVAVLGGPSIGASAGLGSVGGRVVSGSDATPVSGVWVQVTGQDRGPDGVLFTPDDTDVAHEPVQTGADGSWRLDVAHSDGGVRVELVDAPSSRSGSSRSGSSGPGSSGAGASGSPARFAALDSTVELTVGGPATVGDRVWFDADGDGVQDPAEPGIGAVRVDLLGPEGALVATTWTDPSGGYHFGPVDREASTPAMAEGSYTVGIDTDQPPLRGLVAVGEGARREVQLGGPGAAPVVDADVGFHSPVPRLAVGGIVWVDGDGNGRRDRGEPGIGGVRLLVTGPDGVTPRGPDGRQITGVVSRPGGRYRFDGLPVLDIGDRYTVEVVELPGRVGRPPEGARRRSGEVSVAGADDSTVDLPVPP